MSRIGGKRICDCKPMCEMSSLCIEPNQFDCGLPYSVPCVVIVVVRLSCQPSDGPIAEARPCAAAPGSAASHAAHSQEASCDHSAGPAYGQKETDTKHRQKGVAEVRLKEAGETGDEETGSGSEQQGDHRHAAVDPAATKEMGPGLQAGDPALQLEGATWRRVGIGLMD